MAAVVVEWLVTVAFIVVIATYRLLLQVGAMTGVSSALIMLTFGAAVVMNM